MNIVISGVRGIPARYGGFEISAEETACRMQKLGHQVTVYCRAGAAPKELSVYKGVRLVHLPALYSKNLETMVHSIQVAMDVILHNRNTDVVHLYNAASVFGGILLRLAGKPLVMTLDGVEWQREKWGPLARLVWKVSTWLAVRVANVPVCDSQTVKTFLEARYRTEMAYIPYGAKRIEKVSEVYRNFGLESGKYFIFVGRLVPEKGVETLLDAYNALGSDMPLVIVGDNDQCPQYVDSLRQKANEMVRFLGFRYGDEYESLLFNSSLYLTATKLEGTSPSLLAAMGASVCCLASAIPENRETGGDSILYFDGTAQDLTEKWRLLCEQPALLRAYAARGYARVTSRYNWDVVTRQYLDAYGQLVPDALTLRCKA